MKKLALLLTIVCITTLNGMKRYDPYMSIMGQEMLPEITELIVSCLPIYGELDDIVYSIQATSITSKDFNRMVNKKYGSQSGFTKLVHILSDRFDISTSKIARNFKMPIANTYYNLNLSLLNACCGNNFVNTVPQLIKQGSDINFSSGQLTPLYIAIVRKDVALLQLLLSSKAKPILRDGCQVWNNIFFALTKEIEQPEQESKKNTQKIKD